MAGNSTNPRSAPAPEKELKAASSASKGGNTEKPPAKTAASKSAASRAAPRSNTGKSASGKSSGKKQPPQTAKAASGAPARSRDPIHNRGLKVVFCASLAFFSFIGCFTTEGIFIWFFRRFMQGLIGKGFYFLPLALLFCAAMLEYVRDRPLSGRITCTLLLPVTMGALLHLFGCIQPFPWS